MLKNLCGLTTPRGWLGGAALLLNIGILLIQIDSLVGTAVCFEQARWLLVLCASPPPAWQFGITMGLAVAFAVLFGSEWRLAVVRRQSRAADLESDPRST
jgi:hypothetical protein